MEAVEGVRVDAPAVLQAEQSVRIVPDAVGLLAGQIVLAGRPVGGLGVDVVVRGRPGAGDLCEGAYHDARASGIDLAGVMVDAEGADGLLDRVAS